MLRRSKSKSVVDLTPLLDVVLILLFALLMTMSFEQDTYKAEASQLDGELEEAQQEKDELTRLIEEQKEQIDNLENNLGILNEQSQEISNAVATWFTNEEIRDKELVTSEDLKKIFDVSKTNQSLSQMNLIANQFFLIEIKIDENQLYEVVINEKYTNIELTNKVQSDPILRKDAFNDLFDAIEKELTSNKGGYNFVLFTLVDNGRVYIYSLDLIWEVILEIEDKLEDQKTYKLRYLDYD